MPFLAFEKEIRTLICTTNAIESMNARFRRPSSRGHFPTEQAALKCCTWPSGTWPDYQGPNTGIRSSGWKQALQAFTIYFDGRIPTP